MSKHIRKVLGLLQHRRQIPPPLQQPTSRTPEEWSTYWKRQGQPWRTEPEIDKKRQEYLAKRRLITPDIQQGIYPFKGEKLSRADIEWLLATHENGRGPVDWSYDHQRRGEGLDLRGADLCSVDLHGLPLACICCGLSRSEAIKASLEQRTMSVAHLEGVNLSLTHLQGADLFMAHLERANLSSAHLEGADLYGAHLEGAYLKEAFLGGASLRRSFFDATSNFNDVTLEDEKLGCVMLAGVQWGNMDLSRADWAKVKMLGDENEARRLKRWDGKLKSKKEELYDYEIAVHANRQLAVALQGQGLNEEAARFAYRAQVLHKSVLWHQMTRQGVAFRQRMQTVGHWLFSWFLFLLAGYGYRVLRGFAVYVFVIGGFATAYYLLGPIGKLSLSPLDALIFSMTSFHGRGFTPGENIGLSNPLTILAAIEAFVGLVIEVTLIATLTQRFFGK